jgi:hypothetical protein
MAEIEQLQVCLKELLRNILIQSLPSVMAFFQKPPHRHGDRFPRCPDGWRRRRGGYQKDGAKG